MNTLHLFGIIAAGQVQSSAAEVVGGYSLEDGALLMPDVEFWYVRPLNDPRGLAFINCTSDCGSG
jgi:hypothetical protein